MTEIVSFVLCFVFALVAGGTWLIRWFDRGHEDKEVRKGY